MTTAQIHSDLVKQNLSITELTNRLQNTVNETFDIDKSTVGTKNERNYRVLELNIIIDVIKEVLIAKIMDI